MVRLALSRLGATYLALLGINLYYEFVALHVANGFSEMKDHGMPLAIIFVVALVVLFGGAFMAFIAFMSRRMSIVLFSSVVAVVALTPLMGMIAQEVALQGAK